MGYMVSLVPDLSLEHIQVAKIFSSSKINLISNYEKIHGFKGKR